MLIRRNLIISINLLLGVLIWLEASVQTYIDGYILSTLQVAINFVLATLYSIIYLASRRSNHTAGMRARRFWLSVVLVLVVSLPAYMILSSVQHINI